MRYKIRHILSKVQTSFRVCEFWSNLRLHTRVSIRPPPGWPSHSNFHGKLIAGVEIEASFTVKKLLLKEVCPILRSVLGGSAYRNVRQIGNKTVPQEFWADCSLISKTTWWRQRKVSAQSSSALESALPLCKNKKLFFSSVILIWHRWMCRTDPLPWSHWVISRVMICWNWNKSLKTYFVPPLDILTFRAALFKWLWLRASQLQAAPAGGRQCASQSRSALITAVTLLGRRLGGSKEWWSVTQNQLELGGGGALKMEGETEKQ